MNKHAVFNSEFATTDTLYRMALNALIWAVNNNKLDKADYDYLTDAFSHAPQEYAFRMLCIDVIQDLSRIGAAGANC